MNNLNDELINKYIDKELDSAEISELKDIIDSNPEELKKLKTHQFVDRTLYEMDILPAPQNFTEKLMSKINSSVSVKYKKFGFFKFILAIFGLMITGTIISMFIFSGQGGSTAIDLSFFTDIYNTITNESRSVKSILGNKTIFFVGTFFTFLMMVTAYFIIESHKAAKHKLSGFDK